QSQERLAGRLRGLEHGGRRTIRELGAALADSLPAGLDRRRDLVRVAFRQRGVAGERRDQDLPVDRARANRGAERVLDRGLELRRGHLGLAIGTESLVDRYEQVVAVDPERGERV